MSRSGAPRPATFSAAIQAGQIRVGRDVGEPRGTQQFAYGKALAVAVLDDQPTSWRQVTAGRTGEPGGGLPGGA